MKYGWWIWIFMCKQVDKKYAFCAQEARKSLASFAEQGEKKHTQIYISVNYPYAFTLLSLKWFFNTCYCTKFYLLDSDYLMAEREGLLQLWYSLCLVNERDFSKIVFCVITFYIKLNDFSANT